MPDNPFGLSENPFADGHIPRLICPDDRRVEAVALMRRRIADGESFVVVTGDPGCGKTSVVTELFDGADLDVKVAVVTHPSLTPAELLEAVCIEFGAPLPNPHSKPQALASLEHYLRDLRGRGITPVLVLDEAHLLRTDLLEEVRLLSNLNTEGRGLLQTVMVGLPELERRLGLPELLQLRQRIGFHCRLSPLDEAETDRYVQHRVNVAGGDGAALFPEATCHEIYNYSNGVPRDINTLAARALEHAQEEGAEWVTVEHVLVASGVARPRGDAAVREPEGFEPFELRRRSVPRRPVSEPPAAAATPVAPAQATPVARKPRSFLRAQQVARSDVPMEAPTNATATLPVTLEHRFRSGEVGMDPLAIEREAATDPEQRAARSSRSESVQELGASVLLVGLLLVVLMVSGHWGPVVEIPGRSSRDASSGSAVEIDPATPQGELPPVNAGASIDPETPLPQVRRRVPKPPVTVPEPPVTVPEPPVTVPEPRVTIPEPVVAGRPVYGFEVAAYDDADSAAAVLQRITRKSKLPVRIVTRSSGDRYRVVVGPFPRRRDAEKAIHELFRSALVERARLVQITE